ncbi:MAG: hypothetical protein LBI72_10085 [Flavobacteriaceae bacterium]|jgi:hypothetical protein|nr:hypothetical protein [Flavobacteriaceae bacterium]
MQKLFYLLPLLLLPIKGFCGGLSAWTTQTPYNNELYYDGSTYHVLFTLKNTNKQFDITQYYFYKGYLVAQKEENQFYLVNEKDDIVESFTDKDKWEQEIQKRNLNPLIKRTYDSDYGGLLGTNIQVAIAALLFLPLPFVLPIFWIIAFISVFIKKKQNRFRKVFVILYPSILLVLYLLHLYPQSI